MSHMETIDQLASLNARSQIANCAGLDYNHHLTLHMELFIFDIDECGYDSAVRKLNRWHSSAVDRLAAKYQRQEQIQKLTNQQSAA